MSGTELPRDHAGRVLRPKPSQLLADVMEALGPDHLTTRTLMAALIERDRGAGVEPRAVTPGYGWHLPVLADPPNVPYDMQETALDIEATVGQVHSATGVAVAPQPAAVPGGSSVAVTFPVGRFAVPPIVLATAETSAGSDGWAQVSSITAAGFGLGWYQHTGIAKSRNIHWGAWPASPLLLGRADPDPTGAPVEVTCTQAGCGNADQPITVQVEDPATTPIVCGVCGTVLKEPGPAPAAVRGAGAP